MTQTVILQPDAILFPTEQPRYSMPPSAKRSKTETLSLRLDPKTKFMLDFVSRLQGQSITTVVERAIRDKAVKVTVDADYQEESRHWNYYWHHNEGIRTIKLISDPNYPTNYDEDELLGFIKAHNIFFVSNYNERVFEYNHDYKIEYIDVLWPNMAQYVSAWRDQKHINYWIAGQMMCADIISAQIEPPKWPKSNEPTNKTPLDLDEEIPF